MEQSLRLLLSGTSVTEQTLLNVVNKLSGNLSKGCGSDLYILTAERLFDLPHPIQKHIVDKAELMVSSYNKMQEPPNQFQIRAMICQSLICSFRAGSQRGVPATEWNLKAIDFMSRALKQIQANTLYQPLSLRAVFLFNQIAFPFFTRDQRHNLQAIVPLAVGLLDSHLSGKFDGTLRLYITLSLLMGCIYDDMGKSDDASKHMQKLFTLVPPEMVQLRYSLLRLLAHFSRKNSGGLAKMKLDLNEQLQRAIVMCQTARSNNATTTKDLAEVLKLCSAFIDSRKEPGEEVYQAEIVIGEAGRLAAQFNQKQVAEDCQTKAAAARSPIARLHGTLIGAELALAKRGLTRDERVEMVNTCNHVMSLAMYQGDLVTVQDAAAMLWSHAIHILDRVQLIRRYLLSAVDILTKMNSQTNVLRSQMHFALAKMFEQEKDGLRALDQLKKAMALDYLVPDHPTKLIHPFDRFLVPFLRMLNVQRDSYGQQPTSVDDAHAQIALPKKVNPQSLETAFKIMQGISTTDIAAYDPVDAAHFANVWIEVIQNAAKTGLHQIAVDGCHHFLGIELDTVKFDTAAELQCEASVHGIVSCFKLKEPNTQFAVQFTQFSIAKAKLLKMMRLSYNSISSLWNSYFSLQSPEDCAEYIDFLNDCVTHLFESDFAQAKLLIGQFVNLFVRAILMQPGEPPMTGKDAAAKKKAPAVDPVRQKQMKAAEDLLVKTMPVVKSIYEKKALVDRMVEIFAKRNALPPNQSDPENALLMTLATIMNDKVQHKSETLSATFGQIQNLQTPQPLLFALLSERACKLDLHQVTIDSATKTIEMIPDPSNKDELYHCGLSRFYRGLAYLKLIQPEVQEFSCQDKLRCDAAADFLRAGVQFQSAKCTENAQEALKFFVTTIAVGENFPRFRSMLEPILVEGIEITRYVKIGDDLRSRLFRIYLLVLIGHENWAACRKLIHTAITTLDKSVHGDLWELNLMATARADCAKTRQPLLDEMLRVKQLGDAKYQSHLWCFVADLTNDPEVQHLSLVRGLEVLKEGDVEERFDTAMKLARWRSSQSVEWTEVKDALASAEAAIAKVESPEMQIEWKFEIAAFTVASTHDSVVFDAAVAQVKRLSVQLWEMCSATANTGEEEVEQPVGKIPKMASRRGLGRAAAAAKGQPVEEVKADPTTIADWIKMFEQADRRKTITMRKVFNFVEGLLSIVDVMQGLGEEYELLRIWFYIIQYAKQHVQWPRYEQFLHLRLKIFLDRLNIVSPFTYSTDFALTEVEKGDWQQKVERYQADPPAVFPPLRKLLIRQAVPLIDLGEYKPALTLVNTALNQAEELEDKATKALAICMLAVIKARSGELQSAIEFLASAGELKAMPMDFWVMWYSTGFLLRKSDFTESLLSSFQINCLKGKLTIYEQMQVYSLYRLAIPFLSPSASISFFDSSLKGKLLRDESFVPTFDTVIAYYWNFLLDDDFPEGLPHFREFGHEVLRVVEIISRRYEEVVSRNNDEAMPLLCRLVDVINLFGSLVLRYAPVIRGIEANGLDIAAIGSHASLLNEFIDKTHEPLPDLSPTAAILHFNTVQNVQNIPELYRVRMNVFLGQCLHAISMDVVTLQNSVKYLWKGVALLIQLEQFELAGDVAAELFSILRESDPTGSIYQYFVAQASVAYRERLRILAESEPTNRELLFVNEAERLRSQFMNPQISPMFLAAQKYFDKIQNGTTLVRLGRTMEQIKQFIATNKSATIIVIDNIPGEEAVTVAVMTLGQTDKFARVPIEIDIDEAAMKYEIFKQIIATAKEAPPVDMDNARKGGAPAPKGKAAARPKKGAAKPAVGTPTSGVPQASFANEALKGNNPEFQAFISDLNETFNPVNAIMAETTSDTACVISSRRNTHTLPFECISAFAKFTTIYKDFSIMSLLNRKAPSTDPPEYDVK